MTIWFTSDPHFDHANIIKLSNRPFHNVNDMNETIINNYNRDVKSTDTLYILGDFCWGGIESVKRWRNRINCENIHYIWGNHDEAIFENYRASSLLFKTLGAEYRGKINGQYMHLYHYPILEWDKFYKDSWHLFGHVHGNRPHLPGFLGYDVGVDVNGYCAISFEELSKKIDKIRKVDRK